MHARTALPLALLTACAAAQPPPVAPGSGPRRLAPGVVSDGFVFATAFTGDGRELLHNRRLRDETGKVTSLQLWRSLRLGSGWAPPERLRLSGLSRDIDPFVSSDGRLWFNSDRPGPGRDPRALVGREDLLLHPDAARARAPRGRGGPLGDPRGRGRPAGAGRARPPLRPVTVATPHGCRAASRSR